VGYNPEPEVGNMSNEELNDSDLQRILLACLDYGKTQDAPQPIICFSWVARRYESHVRRDISSIEIARTCTARCARKDGDTSRGAGRRYYRIIATTRNGDRKSQPLKSKVQIDARTFNARIAAKSWGRLRQRNYRQQRGRIMHFFRYVIAALWDTRAGTDRMA